MKSLFFAALITLGLGCAGYEVRDASATEALATGEECEISVSCLPDGTCRVEGRGPNGESCWAVLRCDAEGSCEVLESGGEGCEPGDCAELPDCARTACAAAKSEG